MWPQLHCRGVAHEGKTLQVTTHRGLTAFPAKTVAGADTVAPVWAHVTGRLDVLLGGEYMRHLQVPDIPDSGMKSHKWVG